MTEGLPDVSISPLILHPPFTLRQREILQKICDGKSIHRVAAELFISENTVKYHLKSLFKQLQVHNRTMLVRLALQRGWVK